MAIKEIVYFWELLFSACKSLFVYRSTNLIIVYKFYFYFISSSAVQKNDPQRNKVMLRVDNLAELGSLTEVSLRIGLCVSFRVGECW